MNILDRERFGSGGLPIWVRNEHRARWRFASALVRGKVVVDCACGIGLGSRMFAEGGAAMVYGFDLSEEAVAVARENCAQYPLISIQQADGRSLPLPNASIDLFVSFETIEHIEDAKRFVNEIVRVLKPDGQFLVSTPNRSVTMPGKGIADTPWNPFHVREYNLAEFQEILKDAFRLLTCTAKIHTPCGE
jgi:2-polyprenyl-3-methyl-5-hydroxy-6-metoxy-1,4-benzoquinol methylase